MHGIVFYSYRIAIECIIHIQYTHTHTHIYIYIYIYAYIYIYMYIDIYIFTYLYIYTHMCTYMASKTPLDMSRGVFVFSPTCQVKVARFYVSCLLLSSSSPVLLLSSPPPPRQPRPSTHSVPCRTSTAT